ncbi:MAG: anthranilate synthase component I [Ferrovum sp. 37-45-19]|uniref:anthranilate synthase component I n=1 Tax=Ferrovum sp. JA12 TaxID=1356299 RepID=UPI0007027BFF|nr:anthranilate synthase component I [Ferrovum sp. JA12]OYV80438.1 MAG: anthranilate synthase component I [Ferrovum sp. 21-44-67]OYV94753.1 MAG: anthranilate synthase component I [Ferrovum sp. 37-45-19]OZB31893.1 MAG: anthranilate synthase component I [Ferrovum sp. 34-44-207]HQT81129.1 anthranilate synthase component I [Ferrovaceae bacterium]KRH79144.1 anthranilate synthase component 1 [Ferrovum sp. JA12]
MTKDEFIALSQSGYNLIPVVKTQLADLDTPLSVYAKLAQAPYTFLLESVHGGERFGRYSFIGLPAQKRIRVTQYQVVIETEGMATETLTVENPLDFIEHYQGQYKAAPIKSLPRFCGGLAGYFGHDIIRYIEPRLSQGWKEDDIGTPDILLLVTTELVVIDNLSGQLHLIVYANAAHPQGFEQAVKRLDELSLELKKPPVLPELLISESEELLNDTDQQWHESAIKRALDYITAGDIMQVVLSRRMHRSFTAKPLALYRALRRLNPSPYMFYYNMGDFYVVGASPEILVRLEQDKVTLRPIAGTRPRGQDELEDDDLARDLLNDPKEIAEHIMLMDLGRNDVGRIAQTGSVIVTEKMVIERYSHVMHIVSNVEGKLKPGLKAMDVLKATFPAGTLSGAPKIRALEIIDELEPLRRGVYGGAVGYLDYSGNMDLAIAIRTAVIKDEVLYVQAGGGIVADSEAANEWQETVNKSRAVHKAAQLAEQGLNSP